MKHLEARQKYSAARRFFSSLLSLLSGDETLRLMPDIQLFLERLSEKNVHATIPKGSMGYDQFTVPDTVAFEPTFVASFSTLRHISMASGAILSNFFEEE